MKTSRKESNLNVTLACLISTASAPTSLDIPSASPLACSFPFFLVERRADIFLFVLRYKKGLLCDVWESLEWGVWLGASRVSHGLAGRVRSEKMESSRAIRERDSVLFFR